MANLQVSEDQKILSIDYRKAKMFHEIPIYYLKGCVKKKGLEPTPQCSGNIFLLTHACMSVRVWRLLTKTRTNNKNKLKYRKELTFACHGEPTLLVHCL